MDHPTAYARTVLVHLALDGGERRSRRRAELGSASTILLEASEDTAAVHIIGRIDASADLWRALGELPPRQRVALVLRYFEDLSEAEAAKAMGCSVGTVKSTTSRALDRLRESIAPSLVSAIHDDASTSANTTARTQATEGSIP
jgi:RNA polymerase sigma factor (sigma-70 family)